jgi:hypothetical protein
MLDKNLIDALDKASTPELAIRQCDDANNGCELGFNPVQ